MLRRKGATIRFAGGAATLLLAVLAYGQTTTGTILGVVADETGARVPGANVTIANVDTGISRSVTTDSGGRYRAPNLSLGQYEVKAELSGFRTAVRRGIQLTVASEAVVDLTLSVGAVTEQVEVTAEAPMVDTTSSTVSGLVADQQVRDLPLNGRSFESLMFLQSGVAPFLRGDKSTEAGAGTKLAISGSRIDANSFLLDGTSMNDQSNMTPGSAAGVLLGVETLREFRVMTSNYSAEYGRVSGGVVNAVTKSGTNNLHGNVFEFIRNDNLDARNFFADRKPEFKRNQFGATLGGPLVRDRLFFFGGYEGLRERLGVTQISYVPIAEARNGFLYDATGQLRFVGVDPAVRPYLNLYPAPNGPPLRTADGRLTNIATFLASPGKPTREDFGNIRIDDQLSANHSFYVRYTIDDSHTEDSNPNLLLLPITSRNQYGTLSETAILSPAVVNMARFSVNRSFSSSNNKLLFDVPESLWFLPGQQFGVITLSTGGAVGSAIDNLGNIISQPQLWARETWTTTDDLTISRGRQTIKLGFLLDRYRENGLKQRIFGGQYSFDGIEAFLANRVFDFQYQTPSNDPIRGWRQWLMGAYLQDDVQLRPNLTVNFGLRYEFGTVPTEVNGKLANYPDPETNIASQPHIGDPWFDGPARDFAPRVGLAWDPFSNGKTSIRAGFGLYYDHATGSPWNRAITRVYPFHQFLAVRNTPATPVSFPRPSPSLITDADPLNLVSYSIKGTIKDPTKVSWTWSIQQEVAHNTVVTASYVGSHSYHTTVADNGNAARSQVDSSGRRFVPQPAQFRNPKLGQVQFFVFNEGNAFYNGLQLGVLRRVTRGLQAQLSYTWSKTISEGDGILGRFFDRESRTGATVLQDPDNIRGDRSLSQTDFRHVATVNFSYALPFGQGKTGAAGTVLSGWSLNGIVTTASGNPVGLVLGFDRTNSRVRGGNSGDRPDLKPGGNNSPVLGGPDHYYDASQFVLPPLGYFGNLARQTLIGPGLATFDFSLAKSTPLHFVSESASLQFRAEFFNLLNRANFGLPFNQPITRTGDVASRAGSIDRTLTTARQIQFGLKVNF